MDTEKLHNIISGLALSHSPEARAQAQWLVEREQFIVQAQMLGISTEMVARMRDLAEAVGPMTLLPNHEVWTAVWRTMLDNVKRGEPPIPDDEFPVMWARAIWRELYIFDPVDMVILDATGIRIEPRAPALFASLIDALICARADSLKG
jgi:hypothetical protein